MEKQAQNPQLPQNAVSGSVTLLNQIRIGNFIQLKNENYITTVEPSTFSLGVMINVNYEPVPLNIDWLIKFGFIKEEEDTEMFYKEIIHNSQYIEIFEDYDDETDDLFVGYITNDLMNDTINMVDPIFLNQINYVHQLQNLYFGITGSDLQIVSLTDR